MQNMNNNKLKPPFPAYKGDSNYIFVSYSHADTKLVYPQLERLKRLGYQVWYDEGVSPGSRWSDELAERINNCSLFLVLITPGVLKSPHCHDELNFVLDTNKPVVAMHLLETELPPGLKLRLGARQAILSYQLSSTDIDRKLDEALDGLGLHDDTPEPLNTAKIDLAPGDIVNHFQLLEVLGEGGMGTVFLAEQREPVSRRVAIKVIKLGMDTKEVLARFEAERQALALLSHPNIATVFESGATSTGRPYFAMEYVPGLSILDYCDKRKLNFNERVALFKQACKGILHAHQKGLIHRDLKSSNLQICENSGVPTVKIIDFGIAKSMQGNLANATLYTRLGDVVGSVGYASPEQMLGANIDVDTRTDVYSLGVVLYELLTGSLPFDVEELTSAANDLSLSAFLHTDPPLPITRMLTQDTLEEKANLRSVSLEKIKKELKGDLSSIVMKAIENEKDERYASVSALMADLERWESGAPVEATKHTTLYLVSRFVRRYSAAVAIGSAFLVTLIIATVTSSYAFIRASEEAERANQLAKQSQTTVDFLLRLFEGSSPDNRPDPSLSARELLDQGAKHLQETSELDNEVKLQLSETVADVYLRLWLPERAIELLRQNLDRAKTELGDEHILVLRAQIKLGDVLRANDELEEAKAIFQSVETKLARVDEVTIDDKARFANNFALVLDRLGDRTYAEKLYLQALEYRRANSGEQSLSVAVTLHNLSLLHLRSEQLDKAEQYARESLEIRLLLFDENHSRVATSLSVLSSILRERGQYSEAESIARRVLTIRELDFGPDNGLVARTLYDLGLILTRKGEWEEARAKFARAMQIYKAGSVDWAFDAYQLASVDELLQQYSNAENIARQALPIMLERYGEQHRNVARLQRLIASTLAKQNSSLAEAESLARASINTFTQIYAQTDYRTLNAQITLAEVLNAREKPDIAINLAEQSLAQLKRDTSISKPALLNAMHTVFRLYDANGKTALACKIQQDISALAVTSISSDYPLVESAQRYLKSC